MKRLIQGFIAGIAVSSAITGLAMSRRSSITAIKSRVKKNAEDLKEKARRTIKVEGDEPEREQYSATVTPEYSEAESVQGSDLNKKSTPGYRKQPSN